ncbi:MAG: biosynthetic-type acetolactate synthase large subunit [Candidatus Gracilibacteria bacterium]|nr:biosynthetic-type acetolactate synthase large subunit [Candidatus Gracilibacteria bacterium]
MTYNCSDAVLDLLEHYGINTMFGYPGGAIIPFYDRIPYHNIKHILVRNEQGAGFAAQGWARSTKKLGVCVATSGPGGTNVITAIADAYMDSIPLLFITGQVPSNMIGKDMFQEADMTGITMNITKHNFLIDDPNKVIDIFTQAIHIATSGRPGPVHIDFPKDIQLAPFPEDFKMPNFSHIPKMDLIDMDDIDKIVGMILQAKKPILLIGHGVKLAGAEGEVNDFINLTNIPTVSTLLAKGVIGNSNENYLGMLGMHGFYHCNMAVAGADLIINIGSRFDDRIVGTYSDFGKNAKIIHVDIDKAELNKVIKADVSINEDAKVFLRKILSDPNIKKLQIEKWWKEIQDFRDIGDYKPNTTNFSMRSVLNTLQNIMNKNLDNFIITTDVGQHQMWSSLNLDISSSKSWLTSGGSGTMGFGLPSAIGAAVANPEKTIILICGDGGIQMNIQELATLKDHNLNVKILILNNSFLGMVRQWQELFYNNNYSQVSITSPDFEMLAKSYAIDGITIKSQEELDKNLENIINNNLPFVANIFVEKEENVFPMVPAGKTLKETILK